MILKVRIVVTSKEEEDSVKVRATGASGLFIMLCLLDLSADAECI